MVVCMVVCMVMYMVVCMVVSECRQDRDSTEEKKWTVNKVNKKKCMERK